MGAGRFFPFTFPKHVIYWFPAPFFRGQGARVSRDFKSPAGKDVAQHPNNCVPDPLGRELRE
jgi:hypothetical protein